MGLTDYIAKKAIKSVAKSCAKEVLKLYPESKAKMPEAAEIDIIKGMVFTEENLATFQQKTRDMLDICCKTINGFCYMRAIEGSLKGQLNFRLLQFTTYMDKELLSAGFPKQSIEQKEEILKIWGLATDNWREITGD